ncbi:hypothetical protein BDZ90DRAFT_250199 [Jaminaea rosea]|uniref:Cytoplasmic tRNA 2-thiolation protein 1 n=1 Tax=Jaminaea rosea TaxID=1569628 RepID=A0A316UUG2_9BASI|nr:hypothetical protein BDZ90DRAFT_250199 [Jaminaea rosea]PWN28946.1 hypothetical protein BDZ90DRAFT_250199 [Jaminaea rosea]
MPPRTCAHCNAAKAVLRRPKTGLLVCRSCFFLVFETEVHETILASNLFSRGDKVAIGASGGKDSTVLAYVMKTLNERYDYGLDLFLLSIDEGITGYRDDSLETVKQNSSEYNLPLKVLSYKDLYGWTMDDIVSTIGKKSNCTFCGVFRRQALDRGAAQLGVDHIVTGHNADDIAETVLMNVLRGDIARLSRCTEIVTQTPAGAGESKGCGGGGGDQEDEDEVDPASAAVDFLGIKRSKPFKYAYEKEIVLYAYFKSLTYFSTECIYSPNAYRGYARAYLKDLEAIRPSAIVDIIHSGEALPAKGATKQVQTTCSRCGYLTSSADGLCKACLLLDGLNKGVAGMGINSKPSKTAKLAATNGEEQKSRPSPQTLRAAASAF